MSTYSHKHELLAFIKHNEALKSQGEGKNLSINLPNYKNALLHLQKAFALEDVKNVNLQDILKLIEDWLLEKPLTEVRFGKNDFVDISDGKETLFQHKRDRRCYRDQQGTKYNIEGIQFVDKASNRIFFSNESIEGLVSKTKFKDHRIMPELLEPIIVYVVKETTDCSSGTCKSTYKLCDCNDQELIKKLRKVVYM